MYKIVKWGAGACILLQLGIAGCSSGGHSSGGTEWNRMSSLEGGLHDPYEPLSPVIQDVYDRSIPEEVYSAE